VPYSVSSATIEASASDANARVSGTGSKPLKVGNNFFDVIVTSKDGMWTKVYFIDITRERSDKSGGMIGNGGGNGSHIPSPAATPAPAALIKAERDGDAAAVTVLTGGKDALETKFTVTPPKPRGKYQNPTKIQVDTSSLASGAKKDLSGVLHDSGGAAAKRLGGELSSDGKTFTFFTYEEETAAYSVIQAADLTKLTLRIGKKTYSAKNAAKNKGELDVAPYIDISADRTMAPLRFVAEALGAIVGWEPQDGKIKITMTSQGKTIVLATGEDLGNGLGSAFFDSASNRTFVPLRYIMEHFGANVVWFNETQEIKIYR
jgi:hypothetical protein